MKIVTLVSQIEYTSEQRRALEKLGEFKEYRVNRLEGDEIVKRVGDAEALIVGSSGVKEISGDVLSKCPRLKVISVFGVGTDFIDLKKASELGIKVINLRGTNSESVAEHVWGMILDLAKKITEAHNGAKVGKNKYKYYLGKELLGKTIGIIGFGEIGSRVARVARGFDMKILAYSHTKKHIDGVEFVELNTLLKRSDVIVISLPLTRETTGLIGRKEIGLMKNDVILVNPAREAIIDKEALLEALESGKLFGFGMELEINTLADKRFYKFKNVLITPHTAFFTPESEQKSCAMAVENVIKFAQGKPENVVN